MSDLALETGTRQWVITIAIDRSWTIEDFVSILDLLAGVYAWFDGVSAIEYGHMRTRLVPNTPPRVVAIQYGSPGYISFSGIAEAMKQVKEMIQYLMDRDQFREARNIQLERDRVRLNQERSDFIYDLLLKSKSYDKDNAESIVTFFSSYNQLMETFEDMVAQKKVKSVSLKRE